MPCLNSEGNLCPTTRSSCQQQPTALSCPLLPILLQLPEPEQNPSFLPASPGIQGHSCLIRSWSLSLRATGNQHKKTTGGEIRFPFPFIFHQQGALPCSFEGTVDIKAAWWLLGGWQGTPPKIHIFSFSIYFPLPPTLAKGRAGEQCCKVLVTLLLL